ncbi:MAG: hypothetical protein LCI00_20960 [Chloroflexi bacterium]|nr:hypothetical protein [Chloroflexota bacterium]MCC6892421.1 hypothetical protein [Anaerolineae bacterium]
MSTMMASETTVPLTTYQKMWLASRFLPVIFFVLAILFSLTLLPNILGQPVPILLPVFLVLVLLVEIYQASKSLRDLLLGVSVVEVDELTRAHRARRGNRKPHGHFTRLGRMRLTRAAYGMAEAGQQYRVVYSPASRIVWSLEAI